MGEFAALRFSFFKKVKRLKIIKNLSQQVRKMIKPKEKQKLMDYIINIEKINRTETARVKG